jgi:hypothetical protein
MLITTWQSDDLLDAWDLRYLEARMLYVKTIGKPYAGNPHVRFDEGPLARASCTAGWGLLNRFNSPGAPRTTACEAPSIAR